MPLMPLMPLNATKSSCTQLLEQVEMNIKAGGYLFSSWIPRCTQTEGCVVVVQVSHSQPASSCAHAPTRFYSLRDSQRMATPQLIAPVKKRHTASAHLGNTLHTYCILCVLNAAFMNYCAEMWPCEIKVKCFKKCICMKKQMIRVSD